MTMLRVVTPLRTATIATAVLLLGSCAGPTPMVDVYVDPVAGDDSNPGSSLAPYRTLTRALAGASRGHVVHLAAGTYDEASGEVWPTHAGEPPVATPNVRDGVTITTDGNDVTLGGPIGPSSTSALVFAGQATVDGVAIVGFSPGVLAGPGTHAAIENVLLRGSDREGLLAYGDAQVVLTGSEVQQNSGAGLAALGASAIEATDTLVHFNSPGVDVRDAAEVAFNGGQIISNGSLVPGADHSGVAVMDDGSFTAEEVVVMDNAYAGIHLNGSATVVLGPGTTVRENFIGVVADAFLPGAATLEFAGAVVEDNEFEGVFWAMPMGERFSIRNTEVTGNGGVGLHFLGDAQVIDLGTASSPGGNDYTGNAEPLILDARPDRAAPDGTIITVSYQDTVEPCLVGPLPTVGPALLGCNGVTVIDITGVNNRVHVIEAD